MIDPSKLIARPNATATAIHICSTGTIDFSVFCGFGIAMWSNFLYVLYRLPRTNLCGFVNRANIVANKIDLISRKRHSIGRCQMQVEGIETECNFRWAQKQQSAFGGVSCSLLRHAIIIIINRNRWRCVWDEEMRTWDRTMNEQIIVTHHRFEL